MDRITKETDHVDDDDDDTKAPSSAKRSRTTQPQVTWTLERNGELIIFLVICYLCLLVQKFSQDLRCIRNIIRP